MAEVTPPRDPRPKIKIHAYLEVNQNKYTMAEVAVESKKRSGQVKGTCTAIVQSHLESFMGKTFILTAGHCLRDFDPKWETRDGTDWTNVDKIFWGQFVYRQTEVNQSYIYGKSCSPYYWVGDNLGSRVDAGLIELNHGVNSTQTYDIDGGVKFTVTALDTANWLEDLPGDEGYFLGNEEIKLTKEATWDWDDLDRKGTMDRVLVRLVPGGQETRSKLSDPAQW
jgi:hypothetical protein